MYIATLILYHNIAVSIISHNMAKMFYRWTVYNINATIISLLNISQSGNILIYCCICSVLYNFHSMYMFGYKCKILSMQLHNYISNVLLIILRVLAIFPAGNITEA